MDDKLIDFIDDGAYEKIEKAHQGLVMLEADIARLSSTSREAFGVLNSPQTLVNLINNQEKALETNIKLTAAISDLGAKQREYTNLVDQASSKIADNLGKNEQYLRMITENTLRQAELRRQIQENSTSIEVNTAKINSANQALAIYSKNAAGNAASISKLNTEIQELSSSNEQLLIQNKALSVEATQLNPIINASVKGFKAQEDSVTELAARLNLLRKAWDALSPAQRNTDAGVEAQQNILALDAQLKQLEAETGRNQRKVGSYELFGGNSGISQELQDVNKQLVDLKLNGLEASDEYQVLTERAIELSLAQKEVANSIGATVKQRLAERNVTVGVGGAQVSEEFSGYAGAATELANVKKQMVDLVATGQAASDEYKVLEARAVELTMANKFVTSSIKDQTTAQKVANEVSEETTTKVSKLESTFTRMALRMGLNIAVFQALFELFGQLSEAWDKATDRINFKQLTMEQAAKNAANSWSEEAIEIGVLRDRFLDVATSMDEKQKIVQTLNDKYEKQIGHLNGITDAEQFFVERSPAMIKALNDRALAEGYYQTIVQNTRKETEALANPEGQLSGLNKTYAVLKSIGQSLRSDDRNIVQRFKDNLDWNKVTLGAQAANETIKDVTKSNEFALEQLKKLTQSADDEAIKAKVDLDGKKKPKGAKPHDYTDAELSAEKEYQEAITKLREDRLKADQAAQQEIYQDEEQSLDARLKAYDQYQKDAIQIAILEAAKEIEIRKELLKAISEAEQTSQDKRTVQQNELLLRKKAINAELSAAEETLQRRLAEINTKGSKDVDNIIKSSDRQYLKDQTETIQEILGAENDQYSEEAIALVQRYQKNLITQKEYEEESKRLRDQYNVLELQSEVTFWEEVLKNETLSANMRLQIEEKLRQARKKLGDASVADIKQNTKDVFGLTQQEIKEIQSLANAYVDVFMQAEGLVHDLYQQKIDASENQISQIEKEKQAEIDAVNASIASQDDKQKKIALINAQAALKEQTLQQQENSFKRKEAAADKVAAVGKIIETTSLAVMKTLSEYGFTPVGIALAAAVGALGAFQLERALAAPIPQYAKGTQNHPGGDAIIGEGGQRELIQEPGKKPYFSPDKATLFKDLPKGTKVIPESELLAGAAGVMQNGMFSLIGMMPQYNESSTIVNALKTEIAGLREEIRNKPETTYNQTGGGDWVKTVKRGNSVQTWLAKNLQS